MSEKMDTRIAEVNRERSRRPVRNKRYTRRGYGELDKRPPKRLFTPEIKRFLKDWLVRRRENPYPNRDEKKNLALQTGLTYIQVCNWFANWRRKLKNAGKEPQRKTWGDLIKSYNSQVQGNVEHFSICSDDSIWEEPDSDESPPDHSYTTFEHDNNNRYFANSPEREIENPFSQAKYKNHIMEKYLRDCQKPDDDVKPSMITKWLESAVNFTPSENNYVHWTFSKNQKKKKKEVASQVCHGREELDAAEALTRLANARAFKA
ncbi:homeobox protein Mohawk [Tribolium castaneum]|nr:PREDICTED: homeobox protein Mohawk [Tribolium castaneum]|eukprot:XP_001811513.2 PREDICTED: homeobox protein Mohawk [Tribolium castaneum]